jgi:uncharacterized protein
MATPLPLAGSPFHAGEVQIQQQLGVAERMAAFGSRVIRPFLPDQHRQFYTQLPFLVLGAVDPEGEVWASLLEGEPGFLQSPDPTHLHIAARPAEGDPAAAGIAVGAAVGLLGIELPTRRRNRLNGLLSAVGADGLEVTVGHAFGNCPQYIDSRGVTLAEGPHNRAGAVTRINGLDAAARALIGAADTFFVASYVDPPAAGEGRAVDVSHRGGKPGFVAIEGDRLCIPDYAGNLHFNTLGNLLLNPRVGLLFIDFATGDVLQLSGRATLHFEHPALAHFRGAERLWTVDVHTGVWRRGALSLRFARGEASPNSLLTGSWEDAAASARAAGLAQQWRPFRVERIDNESASIRSFHLLPDDGEGLPPWLPGQHLPIRVRLAPDAAPEQRSYTLSSAPADGRYRISVKREGRVSQHLHDTLVVGSRIEVRAPAGQFHFDAAERRPAVLLSAGVGITPMIAMLRQLVFEGRRSRRFRRAVFIHGARSGADLAFAAEVEALAAVTQGAVRVLRALSRADASLTPGKDFHHSGRIDLALLREVLGFEDYDFYLCGPQAFMQSLYDQLRARRIPDDRIHAEAFGPSSLRRQPDHALSAPLMPAATQPVPVLFADSAKEARWAPASGSLLELAEQRGLSPPYSCRGGHCGSCVTRVVEGRVTYAAAPAAPHGDDQALICCALPAAGVERLVLAL